LILQMPFRNLAISIARKKQGYKNTHYGKMAPFHGG